MLSQFNLIKNPDDDVHNTTLMNNATSMSLIMRTSKSRDTGVINAKLDPKYVGICAFVIKIYKVMYRFPEASNAADIGNPVKNGASNCCAKHRK